MSLTRAIKENNTPKHSRAILSEVTDSKKSITLSKNKDYILEHTQDQDHDLDLDVENKHQIKDSIQQITNSINKLKSMKKTKTFLRKNS